MRLLQAEMRLLLLLLLLLAPAPGSSAPKARRQSDTWGPWGQWSPCSRTCGGGISFQERSCYSQRRDGGSSCVGPTRSHRSCRTESCPDGARDFRAEQCAEFDGVEFQGRRYRWLPYYGAPNKCELNCIPKGENFYYKHREAVVDGTPCEPGKRDMCVDGSCRVVGCDHQLDSSKQEDKCLQCGGDGTTCYPVTGTFDANDLSRGYNQILIVPMGATSILIEEAAASRNFLAVKNVHGEYYLNGHWTIEAARALPAASTILHYERGAEGDLAPERLHARGPTSEPLVIEVTSPAWCSAPLTTRPTQTTCASASHGRLTAAPATFTLARRPSAGSQGRGGPARPPAEEAPSPAWCTASHLTGLASRRRWRRLSVPGCLGSPLPCRPATCSAALPGAQSPGESVLSAVVSASGGGVSLAGVTGVLCSIPQHAPWKTGHLSLSPVCIRTAPSSVTRPGMLAPGVYAPRAAARALGGDRLSAPLGRPATVGACSTPSLWTWSLVTHSPVIFPRVRTGGQGGAWPHLSLPRYIPSKHDLPRGFCLHHVLPLDPASPTSPRAEAFAILKACLACSPPASLAFLHPAVACSLPLRPSLYAVISVGHLDLFPCAARGGSCL
ncbi:A disintegrin and metalloproteinase with thrombospondin motifs 15-like isoform X2 [Sapajus apella]|uniref:A disintegrin and metalloproteinase with thrombospondin motifs 15-like isoform X2 n=1 Tax=Sapajus apella TaxID=9515 RepID=A0A6J3HEW3_SAPAP|nr:A disintegrin and metalloproteinase with thrombospondin motifs 15-like isoform X2 [Sapajus apella]XP_032128711.1 A disintegrin and metalloproteinase with thrombospondin motifs 15-like isoform X2 [Sapajus apella]